MALLQTNVLEFLVSGSLDGVTPNTPFQRADAVVPRPDPPGQDPENIYQFEVDDLGIIDLTFPALLGRSDGPVTKGNRYIPWLTIDTGGVPGGVGSGINVAAFRPGDPSPFLQEAIEPLAGQTGIYLRRCIFVPHGSALQLGPAVVAGAAPIIVRFAVLLPQTRTEEELIVQACCCTSQFDPILPTCENPPVVTSIDPDLMIESGTPVTMTVFGENFQPGDTITVPGLPVGPTTFIDDTTLEADVTPDTDGVYDVVVTRIGVQDCNGILPAALTVIEPG